MARADSPPADPMAAALANSAKTVPTARADWPVGLMAAVLGSSPKTALMAPVVLPRAGRTAVVLGLLTVGRLGLGGSRVVSPRLRLKVRPFGVVATPERVPFRISPPGAVTRLPGTSPDVSGAHRHPRRRPSRLLRRVTRSTR
ncbi:MULTISPECIES: hypothetical protein [unclassified Saccharothrix]|uniref:hypothetical protein n=1 Tax=unclassified Saccharothrix TaxID=2593673 RepID=UPI00307F28F0